MKPYYEEDGITIYHGDCREVAPCLDFSGLVLTDPPYGINHAVQTKKRVRGDTAWGVARAYAPVFGDSEPFDPAPLLSVGKARILWGANHYASRLPDSSGWLVWDKERSDDLMQATCELAWTDCVKGVRRFRYLWDGARRHGNERLIHPMQKPVALMRWCLSLRWT